MLNQLTSLNVTYNIIIITDKRKKKHFWVFDCPDVSKGIRRDFTGNMEGSEANVRPKPGMGGVGGQAGGGGRGSNITRQHQKSTGVKSVF